jgi:hypothetical protein
VVSQEQRAGRLQYSYRFRSAHQQHWQREYGHWWAALFSNTTGDYNTAAGLLALFDNIGGGFNTAIGHAALFFNTIGNGNIALGNERRAQPDHGQ